MSREITPTLTRAELRLMDVVWKRGEATVNDVLESLPNKYPPAYNTVLTILRILERKGYLSHVKRGRAYVYRPLINRNHAQNKAVNYLVSNFFNNSPGELVLNLIKDEKLNEDELRILRKMIEDAA